MNFGVLTGIRVTHHRARVSEIESVSPTTAEERLHELAARDGVREAFVLHTCNRVEEYVVTADPATGRTALADLEARAEGDVVVRMSHEEGLRHLLRVAAGLESLVLGEDQILGQFRTAYETAKSHGTIGPVLEDALLKAIHVGERARTETRINDGITSLGSAAVSLASTRMSLAGATVLVIGAGEIGVKTAMALTREPEPVDRILLANRTIETAESLADQLPTDTRVLPLAAVTETLASIPVDVVVTATASREPILEPDSFSAVGDTLVIDLAQPRDVDPAVGDLPGITLRDLDDLESITERTRIERQDAAATVEALIDDEFEHLLEQFKRKRADAAIRSMYEGAKVVKRAEVETALTKLESAGDLSADEREIVESLADALVNKLLAAPTRSLRRAAADDDWTTINTALQLFDPDFERSDADRADIADRSDRPADSASSIVDDD